MLRPLAVFVLIGTALFAADRLRGGAPERPAIVVTRERVEALRALASAQTGRVPDAAELAARVRAEVDDELLVREARARGFVRDDPVVFRRLVQNLRFAGADPERGDAALFEEALALGLDESDPVVRRRLRQRMQLAIEAGALAREPDEAALRAHAAAHPELTATPPRLRLAQLFFPVSEAARAEALRDALAAQAAGPDAAAARGAPFLLAVEQPLQTERELGQRFGDAFAEAVFADAAPGRWSGPFRSAYGLHLVFVHERVAPSQRPFEAVREALRADFLARERERVLDEALAALRARTRVVVAEGALPGGSPGS